MGTPIVTAGSRAIAGFKKQTNTPWGTGQAVVCGVGDGLEFNSDGIKADSTYLENEQVGSGSTQQLPGAKGVEMHNGPWECDAYYQGVETLIAKSFGNVLSGPSLYGGSSTVYKTVLSPANASGYVGIYGSLVEDDAVDIKEWSYVKVGGMTLSMEENKMAKLVFDMTAFSLNLNNGVASQNNVVAPVLPANGALTLVTSPFSPSIAGPLTFILAPASSSITAMTITVVGTDQNGNAKTAVYANQVLSAGPVTYNTPDLWRTVTSITISGLTGSATGATLAIATYPPVVSAVLPAAGALTIVGGSPFTPLYPCQLVFTLTHTSDSITVMNVTVVGTDRDNNYQSITYVNPVLSAGPLTFTTTQYWRTVTSVTLGAITGTPTGSTFAVTTLPGQNNSTTTSGISLPTAGRFFVLFNQLHLWCNLASAGALSGVPQYGDEVFVKALEIKTDLKILKTNVTTNFGKFVDEPQINGFLECTVKMSFSEWTSLNEGLYRNFISKDLMKMWVRSQGPIADSTVSPALPFEWDFWFPAVTFQKATDPLVKGPGVIPWDVEGKAQRTLSAPSGFNSAYVNALQMELYNLRSSSPL